VRGIAPHIASRIGARANPGEILVSTTTRDLAATFSDPAARTTRAALGNSARQNRLVRSGKTADADGPSGSYREELVVSAAVRLGWSGRPRRPAMEKGGPSVHHDSFRHKTGQRKLEDEHRPDRKRLASNDTREQPGPGAPTAAAAGRSGGSAWEWPWRLLPPTTVSAPADRAAEGPADMSRPESAEHDDSEEPTLLPAA
jgi:hypothetical protein